MKPAAAQIDKYFADFLCREAHLIIEVDGGTHGEPHEIAADALRTAALEKLGYKIIRAHNRDIYDNIDGLLQHIAAFLEGRGEGRLHVRTSGRPSP